MKIIKEVEVPAVKAHKKKTEVFICDFCQKERKVFTCVICQRHACQGGYSGKSCARYDPHDPGDYPDHYCPPCYDLRFVKYEPEFIRLEEEQWEAEQLLIARIKKESLQFDYDKV